MKFAILVFLVTLPALAQTNTDAFPDRPDGMSNSPPQPAQTQTNQNAAIVQQIERTRTACISGRRAICGKVLKILPDGLVVESGYTNLLRAPLDRSWLVPGTVTASRDPSLVEANTPGSICVGVVVLTQLPKARHAKVKDYDYVIIEGYPAGHYTYNSVGDLQHTVRRFSTSLDTAVKLNLQAEESQAPAQAAGVK